MLRTLRSLHKITTTAITSSNRAAVISASFTRNYGIYEPDYLHVSLLFNFF